MSTKQGQVRMCRLADGKKRPYLVLSDTAIVVDVDVIVAKMTTQQPRNDIFDIEIDWKKAGLAKPSIVRVNKLHTVEKNELLFRVGELTPEDFQKVKEAFHKIV